MRTAAVAVALAVILAGCATRPAALGSSAAVSTAAIAPSGSGSGSSAAAGQPGQQLPTSGAAGGATSASNELVNPPQPAAGSQRTPPPTPSSPTRYLTTDGLLAAVAPAPAAITLPSAGGLNHDGLPHLPVVFSATDVWLDYIGGATEFTLSVDAGEAVGAATQISISYDLTGDGTWDRVETFRYFATDPEPGAEPYTQSAGLLTSKGVLGDLRGGTVQVEIWSALGDAESTVGIGGGASVLMLPYAPLP